MKSNIYQICSRCVMDTTDSQIEFDASGVCNHCHNFDIENTRLNISEKIERNEIEKLFAKIKKNGAGKPYDCIIGLSGGVDSSYVAVLAHKYGLRPLCVHLDNGWNSELAVNNIHSIVKTFNFDLVTHVLDWDEFKDLQKSFFKAHVVDIEVLSDHAIFGVIMQLAKKFKIKCILSGANFSTEFIMPKTWVHRKQDLTNILDIHKKYGSVPLRTFPQVSTLNHVLSMYLLGYQVYKPLNLVRYNKSEVKERLKSEVNWRDYGGKHHESIFTKFYQAHILPTKFKIDKRRAHLSTLICGHQIDREFALSELQRPLYEALELERDFQFVCKKLDFTGNEMNQYLAVPAKSHYNYASDEWIYQLLAGFRDWKKKFAKSTAL